MLSRNKIYHKVDVGKDVKKIIIFCEGDREVDYFKYFKGFTSNIDIIPFPNNNGESDPLKLYENAKLKLFGSDKIRPVLDYRTELGDEVFFVIDTDQWNDGNKIDKLRENCTMQIKWVVNQSNPCFEIWLYYHFISLKPGQDEINKYATFKEFVNAKIPGGFNPNKQPVFFQDAIANSRNNFEAENNQPKFLSTEVFILGETILPFIKEAIDECLRKIQEGNI